MSTKGNLTDAEVAALEEHHNLADGHAFRRWTDEELAIVERSTAIFKSVDRRRQTQIENDYLEAFFTLQRQSLRPDRFRSSMCFTASMGLEVVANYLRLNRMSATLVEPCFDNLADILKRHHVELYVFSDEYLGASSETFQAALDAIRSDAVFLVTPNNPTGSQLTRANLIALAQFCARGKKLLVLDTCFRTYLPDNDIYDQYEILIDSGVDFFVLEDTGKTWPTLEIKAPFFCVSSSIADAVSRIYSDFLLHVSPFSLALLREFILLAHQDQRRQIRDVVRLNRDVLYRDIAGTPLSPQEAPFMSVSWLRIDADWGAIDLRDAAAADGVHVLPGRQFFWSDPSLGDKYIRVALVRDLDLFTPASSRFGMTCRRMLETTP
jgi:aspartate/methionine/tyrosine aminotransferase